MSKRKVKIFKHWFDDVYCQNFWIAVGFDVKELSKVYHKRFGMPLGRDDTPGASTMPIAFTHKKTGEEITGVLLWFPDWREGDAEDIRALCHEAFHAMDITFKQCKILLDQQSPQWNEPQAYYIGFIVRKVFDVINKQTKHKNKETHKKKRD